MNETDPSSQGASAITDDFFGVVLKSSTIPEEVDGQRDWASVDAAVEATGAKVIRYPGGTEAWREFDFTDPDAVSELHAVIDYCASRDLKLSFTVSMRQFFEFSLSGGDGELAMSSVDRAALSHFIKTDLLDYAERHSVDVSQIQLDNEPLHKDADGNFLNHREYGHLAGTYASIIGEIIEAHAQDPQLVVVTAGSEGTPLGAWGINAIINGLVENDAVGFIDAVDLHWGDVTLHPEYEDVLGYDADKSEFTGASLVDSLLWQIGKWSENWAFTKAEDLDYYVSAWSLPQAADGGSSLQNAGLSILHLHAYSRAGLSAATSYALIGADANAMYSLSGTERPGAAVFGMMADSLLGLKAVQLNGARPEGAPVEANYLLEGFADNDTFVFYVINRTDDPLASSLDLIDLVGDFGFFLGGVSEVEAQILGVESGESYSDAYAEAEIRDWSVGEKWLKSGSFDFELKPFEILELTLTASAFSNYSSATGSSSPVDLSQGLPQGGRIFEDAKGLVIGSSADDKFILRDGSAMIIGGHGKDLLSFGKADNAISVWSEDSLVLFDGVAVSYSGIERIEGTEFDDRFSIVDDGEYSGGGGRDSFNFFLGTRSSVDGGAGDDSFFIYDGGGATVRGGEGNDTFFARSGPNVITGGSGDDYIVLQGNGSMINFGYGDGLDTIVHSGPVSARIFLQGVRPDSVDLSVSEKGTTLRISDSDMIFFDGVFDIHNSYDLVFG